MKKRPRPLNNLEIKLEIKLCFWNSLILSFLLLFIFLEIKT